MRIPLLGGIVAAAAVPLSTPGNGNERFKVVRVDFGS